MTSVNIQKMIEDAVETGATVAKSVMLGVKKMDEEKRPSIDIEPVSPSWSPTQSPNASGSRIVSGNCRHTPPALGHTDRFKSVGRHTSAESPGIAKEIQSARAKIESLRLPSDQWSAFKASIFYALVEVVFSMLPERAKIELVRKLGFDVCRTWPLSGNWNVVNGQKFESIIALAVWLIKMGRNDAALIVGYLLGLKLEYCFQTFPRKEEATSGLPVRCTQIQELIPKQLVVGGRLYLLEPIDYQKDYRGMKEQAVCLYMDKACSKNKFFLIANRVEKDGNYVLEIGTTPVPARLYSCAEMAIHENTTIIIFMDMSVAMEFRRIARESSLLEREGIIISGYFGDSGAFEVLDLNDLPGHRVVLVPEFNQESLVSAHELADRCEEAGATSVKIYPWPIFADEGLVGEDLDSVESSGQDQWKDMLLMQAEHLDDIELPSKFARAICNRSLSISDYKKYLLEIGVITEPLDSPKESVDRNEAEEVSFISLGEISEDNPEDDGPLTLEQLINPENSSALYGPTDTAKSWTVDEIAIGIATGTEAFGIPARCARVVCIMDGEISPQKRKKHIMQLLQKRPSLVKLANKNIHIRRPLSGFKRFDEAYADILIPKLKSLNAELFIIDNLQALDPKAGKYSSDNLNQFIQKLEFNGIAVLVVHHSDKDGKTYKGPTDLTDLAQNVFRVDGRKQLRMLKGKSKQVEEACNEGGPVIRLTVEKTKICGLGDCSVIYHLPMYGVWEWIEGELTSATRIEVLPNRWTGDGRY